jgi:hypothetical protein
MADREPVPPFGIETVPWQEWRHGNRFGSRFRALTERGGGSRVGVAIEELPRRAGRRDTARATTAPRPTAS